MSDTLGGLIDNKEINIGDKFGLLTVIEKRNSHKKSFDYICKCDCGNIKTVKGWQLLKNKLHSCGCYLKTFRKLDGTQAAINSLYSSYKRNAQKRNLEFSIPIENFIEVTSDSCYYCGAEPSTIRRPTHYDNREQERWYIYNGIDRLDNSKGYVKGNCVPCCSTCNFAKRTMSKEAFLSWIKRVWNHSLQVGVNKSPGELIDALITTDVKCFMFQEKQLDISCTDLDRLKYANTVLELNKKRNLLMRALDSVLGFENITVTPKTYLQDLDNSELKAEY